jgi:hypothetical protein
MERDQLIETMQQLYQQYKNNIAERPVVEKEVLALVEQHPDDMWGVIFGKDKHMYRQIELAENLLKAKKNLKVLLGEETHPVMLQMNVSLCYTYCTSREDHNYGQPDDDKLKQWYGLYESHFPGYQKMVEAEIQEWEDKRQATYAQYGIGKEETKDTICVVEIRVPMNNTNEHGEKVDEAPQQILDVAINHYNDFRLDSYMELPKSCNNTTLEAVDNEWCFKFYMAEEVDDQFIACLTKELRGQLSDGWGESIEQRGLLIGDTEYFPGWNYDSIKHHQTHKVQKSYKP